MTRRRALVAAAILVGAAIVPATPAAGAPVLALSPNSAPAGTSGTWAITVSGTGFAANNKVDVTFAGAAAGGTATNAQGAFSLPIAPPRRAGGTYSVLATQTVCGISCVTVTGSTLFTSVPPMRAWDEPSYAATGEELCGPAGPGFNWSVHVSGTLWQAGGSTPNVVEVIFYNLQAVIIRTTATVQADGTWQVNGWAVPAQPVAPAGTYTVRGLDRRGADVTLVWNVPCRPPTTGTTATTTTTDTTPTTATTTSTPPTRPTTTGATTTVPATTTTLPPPVTGQPTLACSPCLGPAGFVTQLSGAGFPAGAAVTLRWSPGLGEKVVSADAAGAFSTQMLVMPRDTLGPRQAVGDAGGGLSATAAFLVVPSTVTPSGRDVAQVVGVTQLVHR